MANESIKAAFQRLWEHTINKIEERVEKEEGKGLSTNDFTDEYKNKIDIQPDWNQNDETAVDYVRNRTHWTEGITEVEIYPETTIQITTDSSEGLLSETEPIGLVADDNYAITYNGTDYTCTAIDASMLMNDMPATAIGNVGLAFGTGDSGEPFLIVELSPEVAAEMGAYAMMIDLSGSTEVTVGIIHLQETVHKIPNKYLPKVTVPKNIIDGKSLGSLRTLGANAASEIGQFAFAEGNGTTASGDHSHAEGSGTVAVGANSHAEGNLTTASGDSSHAEGLNATASGNYSHAEGWSTTASGDNSHAEGYHTTASGNWSHTEGNQTTASGISSHAEGNLTTASGTSSHAEGFNVLALGKYSHVEGGSNQTVVLTLTGDAKATTYSLTTWQSYVKVGQIVKYNDVYATIIESSMSDLTITLNRTLSTEALDSVDAYIIFGIA